MMSSKAQMVISFFLTCWSVLCSLVLPGEFHCKRLEIKISFQFAPEREIINKWIQLVPHFNFPMWSSTSDLDLDLTSSNNSSKKIYIYLKFKNWTLFTFESNDMIEKSNCLKLRILFNSSIVGKGGYLNPIINIKETRIESAIFNCQTVEFELQNPWQAWY